MELIWYIVLVLAVLIIIGFIICIRRLVSAKDDCDFLSQYFETYASYLNEFVSVDFMSFLKNDARKNPQKEAELYSYLIRHSSKAEYILGPNGYLAKYQVGNLLYSNYPLLSNTINQLRFPDTSMRDFELLQNMLVMTIQENENMLESMRKEIKNPFALLREGVNFIVTLPLSILMWSGLLKYRTFSKLTNNWFMRFVNGFIILIGFVGSIMTIILGWEDTLKLIRGFIS